MPITAEARPSTATTTTVRPAVISSRLFANPLGLILAPFRGGAFIHWAHGGCLGGCGQTEGVIKPVAKRPDEFEDASSEFNLGVQIVSPPLDQFLNSGSANPTVLRRSPGHREVTDFPGTWWRQPRPIGLRPPIELAHGSRTADISARARPQDRETPGFRIARPLVSKKLRAIHILEIRASTLGPFGAHQT
jgi:hypothetical protein